jgi:hypothetical protein
MKKYLLFHSILTLVLFFHIVFTNTVYAKANDDSILYQTFNLAGERTQDVQFYIMESRFTNYSINGERMSKDSYKVYLKYTPAKWGGNLSDEYTCLRFLVKLGNAAETAIPALEGWSYTLSDAPDGLDDKGQLLGIEHSKFENLVDENGTSFAPDKAYMIYNTFIDFHAICFFCERTDEGKGIQDLTRLGQKIVHAGAFSEAPVNLGSHIAQGSTFTNGEITLTFKGLSVVDNVPCAIVFFDSGESSFKMFMNPMPDMDIKTIGSSHYNGDIYIDLASNWIQKAVMEEIVVSETTLPFPPNKVNAVTERYTILRNVSEVRFE